MLSFSIFVSKTYIFANCNNAVQYYFSTCVILFSKTGIQNVEITQKLFIYSSTTQLRFL